MSPARPDGAPASSGDDRISSGDADWVVRRAAGAGLRLSLDERSELVDAGAVIRRMLDIATAVPLHAGRPGAPDAGSTAPRPPLPRPSGFAGQAQQSSLRRVQSCLAAIAAHDTSLRAFVQTLDATAPVEAEERDRESASGRCRGPLHGLPIALKDVIDLAGTATAGQCAAFAGTVAPADAQVTRRLRQAGMVPVGKTVTWELAIGEPDLAETAKRAVNPWAADRRTGGSSSGSAVAVAAGLVPAALGTDTGGSIRSPAAWCGVVGFKPGFGRVDMRGVMPLAPSFDQVGTLTRSVALASLIFEAVADGAGGAAAESASPASARPLDGIRFMLWREAFEEVTPATAEVARVTEETARLMEELGARRVEVPLPSLRDLNAVFYLLARAEGFRAYAGLLGGRRHLVGRTARERLMSGALLDRSEIDVVAKARRRLATDVDLAMRDVDIVLTPAMPSAAPSLAEGSDAPALDQPLYLRMASLTGQPSLTLPMGRTSEGLPVGVLLTGAVGGDEHLLAIAAILEAARSQSFVPPVFAGSEDGP